MGFLPNDRDVVRLQIFFSYADLEKRKISCFADIWARLGGTLIRLIYPSRARRCRVGVQVPVSMPVTPNFFTLVGGAARLGRVFTLRRVRRTSEGLSVTRYGENKVPLAGDCQQDWEDIPALTTLSQRVLE